MASSMLKKFTKKTSAKPSSGSPRHSDDAPEFSAPPPLPPPLPSPVAGEPPSSASPQEPSAERSKSSRKTQFQRMVSNFSKTSSVDLQSSDATSSPSLSSSPSTPTPPSSMPTTATVSSLPLASQLTPAAAPSSPSLSPSSPSPSSPALSPACVHSTSTSTASSHSNSSALSRTPSIPFLRPKLSPKPSSEHPSAGSPDAACSPLLPPAPSHPDTTDPHSPSPRVDHPTDDCNHSLSSSESEISTDSFTAATSPSTSSSLPIHVPLEHPAKSTEPTIVQGSAGRTLLVPRKTLHSRQPPFADPLDHTPIEGALKKLGKINIRGYLLRWFALEDRDVLYYYKEKGDINPQGSVYLQGATFVEDPKQNDRFSIHTSSEVTSHHEPARIFHLEAASEVEKKRWLDQLGNHSNALDPRNPFLSPDFHRSKQLPSSARPARPLSFASPTALQTTASAHSRAAHHRSSFAPSLTIDLDLQPFSLGPASQSSTANRLNFADYNPNQGITYSAAASSSFPTPPSQPQPPKAPELYQMPEYLVMSGLSKALLGNVHNSVSELFLFFTSISPAAAAPATDQTAAHSKKINSIVRGSLCTALARIFNQGFREYSIRRLFQKCHVWDLIQSSVAINKAEEGGIPSYSSSIVTGTVVKHLEENHRLPNKSVRFRAFVCYGLNERCLHEWITVITSNKDVLADYYDADEQPPLLDPSVSVQLARILQSLESFQFNLDVEYEWRI
ncbi:MAG: hypothetical protein Q8P67_10730 [archaeon]|nr:hypothetical protein [archaeon]